MAHLSCQDLSCLLLCLPSRHLAFALSVGQTVASQPRVTGVTKLFGMGDTETPLSLATASLLDSVQGVGRSWTPAFLRPWEGSGVWGLEQQCETLQALVLMVSRERGKGAQRENGEVGLGSQGRQQTLLFCFRGFPPSLSRVLDSKILGCLRQP